MKVLFICHGNVGRSQMAEAYYNNFTKSNDAFSAGVDPSTPSRFDTLPPIIVSVMNEEDIDVSNKKVKLVSEDMVGVADKIYILCSEKDCPDFLLKHESIEFWDIEDPFQATKEKTREVRNNIKNKILKIIPNLI